MPHNTFEPHRLWICLLVFLGSDIRIQERRRAYTTVRILHVVHEIVRDNHNDTRLLRTYSYSFLLS